MSMVLKSVYKSFGEKAVIKDFSHTFKQGDRVCVMGKSGCGKTTLLNLMLGILTPDTGEISGRPKNVSAVFQEDRLCEAFTPVGNILAVAGKGADLNKIRALLAALGLSKSENTPVSELSGGMKRRVAIARALMVESDLVILDEPFKGLDDDLRESVIKTILSYTSGKTLVVATHDIRDAQLLGAEIINID
ncbi:MAG: ABC transporter ATP-binding protein [Ruminococcaceae bacterium]|nr:ABC transporter ATP-binding protein [Oscillospiraceae bacterium]